MRSKVTVSAPPEDGRANKAVEALLAATLGLRPSQVHVVKGQTQRLKVVQIDGVEQAAVDARCFGEDAGT